MRKVKEFILLVLFVFVLAGCEAGEWFEPLEKGGYFTGTVAEDYGGGYLLKTVNPGNTVIFKGDLVAINWKSESGERFQPGELL